MDLNVKDKVYILTGGAYGIGEAVCKLIAEEGGIAVIADVVESKNEQLYDEITDSRLKAQAPVTGLVNEDVIRQFIHEVIEKYGRIDGVVNNAGNNEDVRLENGSVQRFQQSLAVNLVHYFAITQCALPHLKESKGSIVNVGSKVSVTGQGGIGALTREWAVDLLPHGIRVNGVLPAGMSTPLYAKQAQTQPDAKEKISQMTSHISSRKRFAKPEEMANTVVFLLSGASSHTTGQIVFVW